MGPDRIRSILLCACIALALPACAAAQEADALRSRALAVFGTVAPVTRDEADDPKAVLGQALFWDARLSVNGRVACASCHVPEAWGADPRPFSLNARGALTSRHSQTIFNAVDVSAGLRWVADRASGAAQAIGSITGSMGFDEPSDIVDVLLRHGYRPRFDEAFPNDADPVSVENFGLAIQAYEETLRTPARFDRWLQGDDGAMTDIELRGLERFIETGCASCHNGALLGGGMLQPFGIVDEYRKHTGSADADPGLMRSTGDEADRYVFRVQPLRNVARTSPYFHDGSVADLGTAIRIMARVQLGLELDETDVEELVEFLAALTGDVPENFRAPAWLAALDATAAAANESDSSGGEPAPEPDR